MRKPRVNLDAVAEEMGVRRMHAAPLVTRHPLPDRPLVRIGPEHPFWTRNKPDRVFNESVLEGAIVWVKPPPVPGLRVTDAVQWLRARGAHVKLLAPDRVDDVVVEERSPDRAPELGADQAREVVYQLCRELADQAGVPREAVIEQVEPYLSQAGL